jgi:hypothetical protein
MDEKIFLNTCFSFPGRQGAQFALTPETDTVGGLLRFMGEHMRFSLLDKEGRGISDELEVRINGKDFWFYPDGLNTPLHEGDVVEIYTLALGGG